MSECPDEEVFAAWATGALSDADVELVEVHVDACQRCRQLAVALARSSKSGDATARPMRMGRFLLLDLLGRGGMGEVYAATSAEEPGPRVALKVLRDVAPTPLLQFKQEFRALADMSHPSLVQLHELACAGDDWFITMELIDGVDFMTYVRDGSRLRVNEARLRAVLAQLVDGLATLHAAGHAHRDMKPSNVLIDTSGRLVILDFGLIATIARTERGLAGTPPYMAPELLAGATATASSDWFSVGVMLHEALTGKRPRRSGPAIDKAHTELIGLFEGPLADLSRLCAACLSSVPSERPTGTDFANVLGRDLTSRTAPETRLFGRGRELAILRAAFANVELGESRVVTLSGDSGIGKTTLVRSFIDTVRSDSLPFEARCYDRESVPYKAVDPVVDEIACHLCTMSPRERDALRPREITELVRMFPVMRRVFDEVVPTAVPEGSRRHALDAMRALLGDLAKIRPVIVWIDDAQWGDEDSAPIVDALFSPPPSRVLLLASHRTGDIPLLRSLVGRCEIDLGPLSEDCSTELALSLLGRGDEASAARIAADSGGNPLFVAELARTVGADGPASLGDAIARRLQKLPTPARALLCAMAVAGRPIPKTLAVRVAEIPADESVVARLRAERWIYARNESVEIAHDRIRQAVRGALDESAASAWHRRIAEELEIAASEPEPDTLLEHWLAAGDSARALHYAEISASRAMAALAFERAARLYELARKLCPLDDVHASLLSAARAEALAAAGRGAEAARAYNEARRHAPSRLASEYARRGAEALLKSGRIDEALDALELAMPVRLSRTPRRALVSLALRRMELRVRLARPMLVRESPDPDALRRVDASWAVASALATVDTIRGADLHARALLLALDAGEPSRIARGLAAEAAFAATAGPPANARVAHLLRLAEGATSAQADAQLRGTLLGASAMAAYLTGRWSRALERFDEAERCLARAAGTAWERGTAHLYALLALTYVGRIAELRGRVVKLLADAEERGDLYASTSIRTAPSNIAWLAGDDPAGARLAAEEGQRLWSRRAFHLQHHWSVLSLAQIDLYEGDGDRAIARVAEQWSAFHGSLLSRIQVVHAEALHLRARAALGSARGSARKKRLALATKDAARLRRLDAPYAAALSTLVLAGIDASEGNARAAARYAEASRSLEASEMRLFATVADRRNAELVGDSARVQRCDAWMRDEHVDSPERMAAMIAPVPCRA